MCRYYSISRFEVGSGGNGGRSERREGYPQPLLGHPSCQPVPDQPTINLQKSHSVRASSVPSGVLGAARVENAGLLTPKTPSRGPRRLCGSEAGRTPTVWDRGACVGPRRLCGAKAGRPPAAPTPRTQGPADYSPALVFYFPAPTTGSQIENTVRPGILSKVTVPPELRMICSVMESPRPVLRGAASPGAHVSASGERAASPRTNLSKTV